MTLDTKTVYANSKTVFLVQTGTGSKATYKSYTGYANVPDLKDNSGNFVYYCKSGSTVATMVFISDAVSYTHLDPRRKAAFWRN